MNKRPAVGAHYRIGYWVVFSPTGPDPVFFTEQADDKYWRRLEEQHGVVLGERAREVDVFIDSAYPGLSAWFVKGEATVVGRAEAL